MSGLRRMHPEPWWPGVPIIAIDLSAYDGSGPPYPDEPTECPRCGTPIDPEKVRRYGQRYCTEAHATAAWRRRDRLRARMAARSAPAPTPEQVAAVMAECRAAYDRAAS